MKPTKMTKMTKTSSLPFDYMKARQALRYGSRSADDADFEDRYHDCLEKFLRKWNGVGDPIGAVFLYWKQWYKDKDYRKKIHMEELIVADTDEDAKEQLVHDVEVPDFSHWLLLNDDVQKVLATCTPRQLEILAMRMDNVEYRVIGERYGISHQAVMDSYSKLTKKILVVLT